MLGSHSQRGFDQADHRHLDYAGENTFYGLLAKMRGELFRDEDFADLYCPDNGRVNNAGYFCRERQLLLQSALTHGFCN